MNGILALTYVYWVGGSFWDWIWVGVAVVLVGLSSALVYYFYNESNV
jgi:hypothetical protein